MDIEEAVYYLMTCAREETVDKNGVTGILWLRDSRTIAVGCFDSVAVCKVTIDGTTAIFSDADAQRLKVLGKLTKTAQGKLNKEVTSLKDSQLQMNVEELQKINRHP